jgi:hypothetical protein
MSKNSLNIIPIGTKILIELDDDSAESGFVRAMGSEVPITKGLDENRASRGLRLGDRVIIRKDIPDYYEFQFNQSKGPSGLVYCIIDMLDIIFIDNDRRYPCD